uniref:Crinkler effector protein N-terminal domain-containing protein n=1 Tax=Hyaloperonospora arabidopsidis (strain Emoy2) TaxID=559515 RepID=M4BV71_HYAAE
MVQVSLYCAIVGLPQSTFVVDIDTDRSVAHLKKAIKVENAANILCDAGKLRLFLAKKNGVWLRDDGDLDKLIQTERFLDGMEEMRASWELPVYFCGWCPDAHHVDHDKFTTSGILEGF